jgi:hypothetical protein
MEYSCALSRSPTRAYPMLPTQGIARREYAAMEYRFTFSGSPNLPSSATPGGGLAGTCLPAGCCLPDAACRLHACTLALATPLARVT